MRNRLDSRRFEWLEEKAHSRAAARLYLRRRWSVLPLRPHDKRPLIPWTHLQTSRPSENDIDEWFERWPDANIGIVTGEISNLVVLDVDPKHGGDAALAHLEQRYRPLPITIEAITGGGGWHFYFAHPSFLIRNRAGLAQGIDLRWGRRLHCRAAFYPSRRPPLCMGCRAWAGRGRPRAFPPLARCAAPRRPRRSFPLSVARARAGRRDGGRAQFDDRFANRPFAVA